MRPFLFASQQLALQLGHEGKSFFSAHAQPIVSERRIQQRFLLQWAALSVPPWLGSGHGTRRGRSPVQGIPVPALMGAIPGPR